MSGTPLYSPSNGIPGGGSSSTTTATFDIRPLMSSGNESSASETRSSKSVGHWEILLAECP